MIGVGGPDHLAISIGAAFGGRVYAVTSSRNKVQDALERGAALAGSAEDVARRLHDDGGAEVVLNTVDDLGPLATIMTEVAIGAKIVLAAAQGHPNAAVAADLDVHVDTVRKWRERYARAGWPG